MDIPTARSIAMICKMLLAWKSVDQCLRDAFETELIERLAVVELGEGIIVEISPSLSPVLTEVSTAVGIPLTAWSLESLESLKMDMVRVIADKNGSIGLCGY
jgi:hypothetical protein